MKVNLITDLSHQVANYGVRYKGSEKEIGDYFIPNKQSGYKWKIIDKKDGHYILSDGNAQHIWKYI